MDIIKYGALCCENEGCHCQVVSQKKIGRNIAKMEALIKATSEVFPPRKKPQIGISKPNVYIVRALTNSINENTGEDEVEDVEHGPPPHPDGVGDVRVGLLAAAVVDQVVLGGEGLEVELSVQLEVAQVVLLGVPQVQLKGRNIS